MRDPWDSDTTPVHLSPAGLSFHIHLVWPPSIYCASSTLVPLIPDAVYSFDDPGNTLS